MAKQRTKKGPKAELVEIETSEVSFVDAGANGFKYLVVKRRAEEMPIQTDKNQLVLRMNASVKKQLLEGFAPALVRLTKMVELISAAEVAEDAGAIPEVLLANSEQLLNEVAGLIGKRLEPAVASTPTQEEVAAKAAADLEAKTAAELAALEAATKAELAKSAQSGGQPDMTAIVNAAIAKAIEPLALKLGENMGALHVVSDAVAKMGRTRPGPAAAQVSGEQTRETAGAARWPLDLNRARDPRRRQLAGLDDTND